MHILQTNQFKLNVKTGQLTIDLFFFFFWFIKVCSLNFFNNGSTNTIYKHLQSFLCFKKNFVQNCY